MQKNNPAIQTDNGVELGKDIKLINIFQNLQVSLRCQPTRLAFFAEREIGELGVRALDDDLPVGELALQRGERL